MKNIYISTISIISTILLIGCSSPKLSESQAKELIEQKYEFPIKVPIEGGASLSVTDASTLVLDLMEEGLVRQTGRQVHGQDIYEATEKGAGLINSLAITPKSNPWYKAGHISFKISPYEKILKSV